MNPDKNGEEVTEKIAGLSEGLMNTPQPFRGQGQESVVVGDRGPPRGRLWAIPRKLGELNGRLLFAVS